MEGVSSVIAYALLTSENTKSKGNTKIGTVQVENWNRFTRKLGMNSSISPNFAPVDPFFMLKAVPIIGSILVLPLPMPFFYDFKAPLSGLGSYCCHALSTNSGLPYFIQRPDNRNSEEE